MNIHVHVHHHDGSEARLLEIQSSIKTVMTQSSSIDRRLGLVIQTQEALVSNVDDLQVKVDALAAEVQETKATSANAVAKLVELKEIIAGGAADAEKIAAISVKVDEAIATLDASETALEGEAGGPA